MKIEWWKQHGSKNVKEYHPDSETIWLAGQYRLTFLWLESQLSEMFTLKFSNH